MKILDLYLENHLPILAGMEKNSIYLDLRKNNNKINIIIGKMGSGKTYILSHLQPFASVGTLDERSQDDLIIPKMNGKKIIRYQKGSDIYEIEHNYLWNEKSHSTKSYIKKNDVELNENGNQGSFKTIIQYEFGIEQNFLRLLRLGPNVVNFINMTTTERKNFVSYLLADSAIFNLLHKKWSEELRALNSQSNVLNNKLNHIGLGNVDKLKEEYSSNEEDLLDLNSELDSITKKMYSLIAENDALLDKKSINDASSALLQMKAKLVKDIDEYKTLSSKIESFKDMPDVTEISKTIGRLDMSLENINATLNRLEAEHKEKSRKMNELNDKRAMTSNKEYMKTLEATYNELLKEDMQYQKELQGFNCEYTSTFLTGFIGDLHSIDVLINDIIQYHEDSVQKIYNSDSSIIRWAQKQVGILEAKKIKLQRTINNIKFSEKYEAPSILYRPPFCPTESCPYYKTHPYTIQKNSGKKEEINAELLKYQNDIKDLDVLIYRYSDYPLIYSKMVTLKELWSKSSKVLHSLGALNTQSLLRILTNFESRTWYNYDKLIQILETATKREKYYELTEKMNHIKNELNMMKLSQEGDIDTQINQLSVEINKIEDDIADYEQQRLDTTDNIVKYNQIYMDLSQISMMKESLDKMKLDITVQTDMVSNLETNIQTAKDNLILYQNLNTDTIRLKNEIRTLVERNEKIKAVLNDIQYTKSEFEEVLKQKEYMEYMVKAVSAKEGIPLELIGIFLESCRDTINDLISTVCEDNLEILPFKIDETSFEIPYAINGLYVGDISKASQGQVSIASTAISFALVRESILDYNIMLLDEVDGPLYKENRNKFISILLKQIDAIGAEQVFLISHNNVFENYPINVIMTTDEIVSNDNTKTVIRL